MGSYYCRECDNIRDSHDGCHEDPRYENELLCPDCFNDLPDTPQVRQSGVFSADQLAIIKKLEEEDEDE